MAHADAGIERTAASEDGEPLLSDSRSTQRQHRLGRIPRRGLLRYYLADLVMEAPWSSLNCNLGNTDICERRKYAEARGGKES